MTDALKERIDKVLDALISNWLNRQEALNAIANLVDEEYKPLSEEELYKIICNLELDVHFKLDKDKTDKEIICILNERVSKGIAKALANHISKPETLSEEEIISIIKGSELWRMSNYCGRDKVFGEDKYTGTEMLAKSLVGHIPRKQEGLCPKCNRQVSAVLCHCGKQEVKLTQSQIDAICAAEGYTREMLKEKKQEVSLQQIQNILLESINEEGKCSTRDMAERIHGFLYKPEGSEKI